MPSSNSQLFHGLFQHISQEIDLCVCNHGPKRENGHNISYEQKNWLYYCPSLLLSVIQKAKASFLNWLQTHTDQNGFLTLSKAYLKMVSSSELQDGLSLPEGSLALVTDSLDSQNLPQFCMETYCNNLKTSLLGQTLLYAEVVTSTMDLFEGWASLLKIITIWNILWL